MSFLVFDLSCENAMDDTSRRTICEVARDGGSALGVWGPPIAVLIAGAFAAGRESWELLVWVFAVALVIGVGVPFVSVALTGGQ
jgi:hypothetical protein